MRVNGNLELNALGQSEIQNLIIERASSLPAFISSEAGRVIYHATESVYYMNNGAQWTKLATGGDAASLENEVDAIEAAVGLALNGGFIPWTGTNFLNTAATIKDGVTKLDTALKAEELARVNADNALQSSINAEASARQQGDDANAAAVAAEQARAEAAESGLSQDIAAEANAREQADDVLQAAIAAEETRAKNAEAGLLQDIADEEARAKAAEAGLSVDIQAEVTRATGAEGVLTNSLNSLQGEYDSFVSAQEIRDNTQDAEIDKRVLKSGDTMTGTLSMNSNRITGLPAPVGSGDAVNKEYTDQLVNGLKWKDPVRAANLIGAFVNAPAATAQFGDTYIVGSAPTAVFAAFSEGDVVQFVGKAGDSASDASKYALVESNPLVVGDRFIVAATSATAPLGALVKNSLIVVAEGNTFTVEPLVSTEAVYVHDEQNVFFGQSFMYTTEGGAHWVQFSGPSQVAAGMGLYYEGNVMHVGLGAGISELPSDEIGIDVFPSSGLMLTEDGTAESVDAAARLAIKRDGLSLTSTIAGLRVSQTILDDITNNETAIENEEIRALAAEKVLEDAIAAEEVARVAADEQAATALQTEVDARIAADAALTSSISAEVTARQNADAALQSDIDAEASRASAAEVDLKSKMSATVADFNARIGKMYHLYESSSASTTHTVAHNLGVRFVNVTVYFADTNEQILPQSVVTDSNNQLTVTFNQSINARVVVMGLPVGDVSNRFSA